jgi:putative membrane protein
VSAWLAGLSAWDRVFGAALVVAVTLYAVGLRRLWRQAGARHGLRLGHVLAYAGALLSLAVALFSPLDALADVLFSAHMGQHELLMLVAAPLLVIAQPFVAYLFALPPAARARIVKAASWRPLQAISRTLTSPIVALVLHAVALWIWHVPRLFEGALAHEAVHALQHFCFFVTAALFWWALVHGRYGRLGYGAAVLFVFLTGLHSGLLGAMLTFAGRPWYPTYVARTHTHGVDALEDQQLAGLLMWIPAALVFLLVGLALLAAWLGEADRRARRRAIAGRL